MSLTGSSGPRQQDGSTTDTRACVTVSALGHAYRGGSRRQRLFDGLDLQVAAGESVALIGRSGSGKSTLLNLIGGIEQLQQGSINVLGRTLDTLNDRQRTLLRRHTIGFVHQAFNLVPTLTVADNVALPLTLAGVGRVERERRLQAQLAAVGLPERESDYPDTLSGGEQQRVAIARALIHEPPLLLADEPTGNLDASSGRQVLELLETLVAERQTTMLVVTHSLEVARVCDRVLSIANGRLAPVPPATLASGNVW